ncbi:hypothetical protein Vadar_010893 [Vaccinium darrowii]|uniref:Uncharacterized protein n=1 Tax=Vaccinium darrowii TaxID=229202 RepID=A0ACB7YLB2_9ERIC|nr:hypothetical protein Vadar_010893 [Vaccinium darrowii]
MENFTEKFPVAVFVTALMPGPSLSISTLFQEVEDNIYKASVANSDYIVSEKDKVGKEDFQWWMMEKNPPDKVEERLEDLIIWS